MKTTQEVTADFVAKTKKAQENHKLNMMLSTLTPADKAALEILAKLDDSSGSLHRLFAIYQSIKQSS